MSVTPSHLCEAQSQPKTRISLHHWASFAADYERLDEDMAERVSAMKTNGEDDMAYFERRYQERVLSPNSPQHIHSRPSLNVLTSDTASPDIRAQSTSIKTERFA